MILADRLRQSGNPVIYIGAAHTTTGAGNWSVDITTVSFQAGDLCILFVADAGREDSFTVSGFTELVASNTGNAREGSIWTKVMAGGETSIASTSYSPQEAIVIAAFFRNATITAGDCAKTDVSLLSPDASPDPPATSVSNVFRNDMVVIAVMQDEPGNTWTSLSSGFTVVSNVKYGETNSCLAYRNNISGSTDPGTFSGTFDSQRSISHTLVLRRV